LERKVDIAKVTDKIQHDGQVGEKEPIESDRNRLVGCADLHIHPVQCPCKPIQIVVIPIGNQIEILCREDRSVNDGGNTADNDVPDTFLVQDLADPNRIEHQPRTDCGDPHAASRMAIIALAAATMVLTRSGTLSRSWARS
jgi:hypothetical protein